MSAENDARTRLLAYYEEKAQELEADAELAREELEQTTDPEKRQRLQIRIKRLLRVSSDHRDKAARMRAAASPRA